MEQKFYTTETIKETFNNLTKWQQAYIRDVTSLIEEKEVDNEKVIQNLINYINNISNVEISTEPYEDILNIVM